MEIDPNRLDKGFEHCLAKVFVGMLESKQCSSRKDISTALGPGMSFWYRLCVFLRKW